MMGRGRRRCQRLLIRWYQSFAFRGKARSASARSLIDRSSLLPGALLCRLRHCSAQPDGLRLHKLTQRLHTGHISELCCRTGHNSQQTTTTEIDSRLTFCFLRRHLSQAAATRVNPLRCLREGFSVLSELLASGPFQQVFKCRGIGVRLTSSGCRPWPRNGPRSSIKVSVSSVALVLLVLSHIPKGLRQATKFSMEVDAAEIQVAKRRGGSSSYFKVRSGVQRAVAGHQLWVHFAHTNTRS